MSPRASSSTASRGSCPTPTSGATSVRVSADLLGLPFGDDDGAVLGRDELFAGWRLFFERLASTRAGDPARRGCALCRRRAARFLRAPGRLGSRPADLRAGVRSPRGRGAPAALWHRPQPHDPDARSARHRVDGSPGRRTCSGDAGRGAQRNYLLRHKEFRSSRSRRFGRSSTKTSSSRARASTGWLAMSGSSPCPTACTRCSLPGSTHSSRSREI